MVMDWNRLTPPRTASGPTAAFHIYSFTPPDRDAVARRVRRRELRLWQRPLAMQLQRNSPLDTDSLPLTRR